MKLLAIAALIVGSLFIAPPAHAATFVNADGSVKLPDPTSTNNNCVISTNGKDANNNLNVTGIKCYDTRKQMQDAQAQRSIAMAANVWVIATHFDGYSGTGAGVSIEGVDCSGGGLNLPTSWNDKISSTLNNYCGIIVHYEHFNYTGAQFWTYGVGTMTNFGPNIPAGAYLNNRTTSIIYTS